MSWLYEHWTRTSEKNGSIDCTRVLGSWTVRVGGYSQSGPFNRALISDALTRVPSNVSARRLLMLGLGGGSMFEPLRRRFPNATIDVIEWDPVMVEVAERVLGHSLASEVRVHIGDASSVLATMKGQFDFTIFDLYTGPDIEAAAFHASFIRQIQRLSQPGGWVWVNAFLSQELLDRFSQVFEEQERWFFRYNFAGLYRVR